MFVALLLPAVPALAQDLPTVETSADRAPVRFLADEIATFDAPADDAFGLGREVRVAARIDDNVFAAAKRVSIDAPVGGDLYAAGEQIRIDAPIAGDVYAAGKEVVVGDRGSVGGELWTGAKELRLDGPVAGDVHLGAGLAVLGAPLGGDVDAHVGELQVGPGASIAGDLTYEAPQPADGVDGAVRGHVEYTRAEPDEPDQPDQPEPEPGFLEKAVSWSLWTSWSYGAKLLVGFALLGLGGRRVAAVGRELVDHPAQSLGIGFVGAFVVPLVSVLALVLILPFPLGVLGLTATAVGLYVGQLVAAQALGDVILDRLQPGAVGSPYVSMAVGLAPIVVLATVPGIGTLTWLAATTAGLGAMWLVSRRAPVV